MTESTNQPLLSGLRVVDMTEALAGPYCTMYLGDMGADVVKIERRGVGDQTRGWGPPFVNGESAYFMSTNRNKRSLTLDITTAEGQAILQRMVDGADIFVNNLPRFSSMQKLGLDPDACLARNPRLIHVCVTSFGHTGPRGPARLRHPLAGDERHHEPDRCAGRRTDALPCADLRHDRGPLRADRHPGRTVRT